MEGLDFTRPARHETYDPDVARACFESLSKAQSVAQGELLFAGGEASERMYLLRGLVVEGDPYPSPQPSL